MLSVYVIPNHLLLQFVPLLIVILLAILGATASYMGGSSPSRGALRVVFWGVLAMLLTAAVGRLFEVQL